MEFKIIRLENEKKIKEMQTEISKKQKLETKEDLTQTTLANKEIVQMEKHNDDLCAELLKQYKINEELLGRYEKLFKQFKGVQTSIKS